MAILDKFSLEGKIALVTGASYGIGFAIATAYAEAGATIVFNDIKQELVDKGLAAYEEKGIKAHGYVCDVTDEEQVNELIAKIEKEVGVIDILVNNAGDKEQCDFYFPGIAREGSLVAGVTASGADHHLARTVTEKLKEWMETQKSEK